MAIADDFSVNSSGDIRHEGGSSTYTVLELHRWLQDLADNADSTGNDIIDISRATPSERSTDQIIQLLGSYNIDQTAAEFLYGGSIKQGTGATEEIYSGLKVLGAVNQSDTYLMVIQANDYYQYTDTPTSPFWGDQSTGGLNGNAVEGVLMRCLIKSRTAGVDIDKKQIRVQAREWGDTYDFFSVTLGEGEAVAAIGTTPDAQNDTPIATVQGWTGGDIPTNVEGYQQIDLNNGDGNQPYYSQWTYNTNSDEMKAVWEWIKELTSNNSPAPADPYDMNGELFLGITHSFAFDGGSGAGTQNEEVVWGTTVEYDGLTGGTFTEGYLVRFSGGAAGTVLYDNGTTTFVFAQEDVTDTIVEDETITEYNPATGAASGVSADVTATPVVDAAKEGGSGALLATTGTTTGSHYIQLLTGKAPVDDIEVRGLTSTNTWDVNGAVTARTVPKVFLGSYTGSLIGAYGVGIDPDDLLYTDTVEDLGGTTRYPPNNVTWYLYGLAIGDRILVGNKDTGDDFEWTEMTIDTGGDLTGGSETAIDVGTDNIPDDAPASGVLRVTLDDGRIKRQVYTSHDGTTFTIPASDYSGDNEASAGNGVMLAFLDEAAASTTESFTIQYDAARTLWVRVRDGGATPIKTYEAESPLGAAGGSATATRISDA
jgi:hypothetical protein